MKKVILILMLFLAVYLCGCRTVVYEDAPPPPPPKIEVYGVAPSHNAVWVPGHWSWRGPRRGYIWVRGHWKKN